MTVVDGILILGLVMVVIGIGIAVKDKFPETKIEMVRSSSSPTAAKELTQVYSEVYFDISGEVLRPGVYKLVYGSRINDGLIAAGGLALNADRDWVDKNINRAEKISDGQKIYIPKVGESESLKVESQKVKGSEVVSLNKATLEQLDTLPGIGPAIAGRIIDYREKNGGFKNIEELKLVSGIGDKMFEEIKEKITL